MRISASVADFRAFADALAELTACGPVVSSEPSKRLKQLMPAAQDFPAT